MTKLKYLIIVVFTLIASPALAFVSGDIIGSVIPVNMNCNNIGDSLAIYAGQEYGFMDMCDDIMSGYEGLTWKEILTTQVGASYPVYNARIIELSIGMSVCQSISYEECLSTYSEHIVATSVASFADSFGFASGFSAGGVATISTFVFTDLFPVASLAIGVFLGIYLLTYVAHLFTAKKRR